MDVNPEFMKKLDRAQLLEDAGRYKEAEICYLELIGTLDRGNTELIGTLFLNVARSAEKGERIRHAIRYTRRAIECLEGVKGDGMLQNAHAHFNLARIYLEKFCWTPGSSTRSRTPRAVDCAEKALDLYHRYPFTTQADLADASALQIVASAWTGKGVDRHSALNTWDALRRVPFETVDMWVATQFLGIVLPYLRSTDPARYREAITEIQQWAGDLFSQKMRALTERPDHEWK